MKCINKFFLVIFIICALCATANANDSFSRIDANGDGHISKDEFKASLPNMHEAAFDTIDSNADSKIERKEWETFMLKHASGMKPADMAGQAMPKSDKSENPGKSGMPLITPPAQQK